METIELQINQTQKEKLQNMCVQNKEPAENYLLMAQILLNEAIDKCES